MFNYHKGWLSIFLIIFGALVLAAVIFFAGMFVGFQKAKFSYRLGEHYYKDFMGGTKPSLVSPGFINSHGATGVINLISDNQVIIKTNKGLNEKIIISPTTTVKQNGKDIKASDLKINDTIAIIGDPDDQGQINARFIRVY